MRVGWPATPPRPPSDRHGYSESRWLSAWRRRAGRHQFQKRERDSAGEGPRLPGRGQRTATAVTEPRFPIWTGVAAPISGRIGRAGRVVARRCPRQSARRCLARAALEPGVGVDLGPVVDFVLEHHHEQPPAGERPRSVDHLDPATQPFVRRVLEQRHEPLGGRPQPGQPRPLVGLVAVGGLDETRPKSQARARTGRSDQMTGRTGRWRDGSRARWRW